MTLQFAMWSQQRCAQFWRLKPKTEVQQGWLLFGLEMPPSPGILPWSLLCVCMCLNHLCL